MQREALFGECAVIDASEGTTVDIRGDALVIEQRTAFVSIDQTGSVCVAQPASRERDNRWTELSALLEEDIVDALGCALRYTGWILDRVDSLHRLTDVVVIAHLGGAGYVPWRTRAEHAQSPNAGRMGLGNDDATVALTPVRRHRQALVHDADRIAEDLAALLRRERAR
jgi:hypothetical protein